MQAQDREALREVVSELRSIKSEMQVLTADTAMASAPLVAKLRDQMTLYLRASGKYPDCIDVGSGVFYQLYDWHVKHTQPLVVGRQPDGRYALQFMFTRFILRPESEASYIGQAYDNR
jgi:hypothetical protein